MTMTSYRIRNPWGQSECEPAQVFLRVHLRENLIDLKSFFFFCITVGTGRWSDGSKEWNVEWGQELLKALDYEFGDDGEFIMEYGDFLDTWAIVERSRLFDEDWVMGSLWLMVATGSHMNSWTYGDVSCEPPKVFL